MEPSPDCPLCPRLAAFREAQRIEHPDWFNSPVRSFGDPKARLLIVGLAPGLRGANRTGRPFTGDYAGDLLYATLIKFGFASGRYRADPADGLILNDCMITNAVRCVPPKNKPLPAEIATCNTFLDAQISALPNLAAIITLGRVAHDASLGALNARRSAHAFGHGRQHQVGGLVVINSYHCSRYNTNTGVLTTEMFEAVFATARVVLSESASS
jgi:uracil-DNA glycosylase family 4